MKIIGIIVILIALIIIWWFSIIRKSKGWLIFNTIITIFVGIIFYYNDNISEISFKDYWKIQTTAKQVEIDAAVVDSLKQRIQNQSATIDLVAQKARKAEFQLDILDSTITLANNQIDTISELSNFVLMVTSAQNDNRYAFDSLKLMALDTNYRYNYFAGEAYISIRDNHNSMPLGRNTYIPWKDGIKPLELSINELYKIYDSTYVTYKPALIEYIWDRKDFTVVEKMDFMVYIMENDWSLNAVQYASNCFMKKSKQKIMNLEIQYFIDWWKENREKYLEK